MKIIYRVFIILLIIVFFAPNQSFGQKTRHIIVEKQVPDSLSSHFTKTVDSVKLQQGWIKLKKGLSFEEVESLLGKPTGCYGQVYDNSTTWYYGERSVVFDNIKNTVRYWEK
jgi:hypothetical protein